MIIENTKTMTVLLSALGLEENVDYKQNGLMVEIKISKEDLMYLMVSSEADIQHIFGKTNEWLTLRSLW